MGDFGLAIQQQQELPFLRAGTLDYMSPEVSEAAGLSFRQTLMHCLVRRSARAGGVVC